MTLNSLDDAFVSLLTDALPDGSVFPATPDLLEEPRGRYQGAATVVAKPRNTGEFANCSGAIWAITASPLLPAAPGWKS